MSNPPPKASPKTPKRRPWDIAPWDSDAQDTLVSELGVSPLLAQLLINRGVRDPKIARSFLHSDLRTLPDPFDLPDMAKGAERVVQALAKKERIVVYGDYDVDGTSAGVILYRFLTHYGADVHLFLPDRAKDGYGLCVDPLKRLMADGVQLVITCDNGTSAEDAICYAQERGVDVIVTDHHSLPDPLPPAYAVINPLRLSGQGGWRPACGAGLAFAFALALRKTIREQGDGSIPEPNMRRYLDLVTLGTVADLVPLKGVNRLLVREGLKELNARRRVGVRALLTVSGVAPEDVVDTQTVGFRLGPRINAAGRIAHAMMAAELLLCEDPSQASRLAGKLEDLNRARQEVERDVMEEALQQLKNDPNPKGAAVLMGEGWHQGVVGIVAARVVDIIQKPVFIIALNDGIGKGSGRSIPGVNLVSALDEGGDLLVKYGGHPMAAGLTISEENLEAFKESFQSACQDQLDKGIEAPPISIDALLPSSLITSDLLDDLKSLAPFGQANPEPVFATPNMEVVEHRMVGKAKDHLSVRFRSGPRFIAGIGFRKASLAGEIPQGGEVAIAHCIRLNRWKGRTSIQLQIKDLKEQSQATLPEVKPSP